MLGVWPSSYPTDGILFVLNGAGANHAYNKAMGAGGAAWDDELGKRVQYRDLIKHPNPTMRAHWLKSGENEFRHASDLIEYLKTFDEAEISNWEAEKYRISLDR